MKKAAWLFLLIFSFFQSFFVMGNGKPENSLGFAQKVEGTVFILSKTNPDKKKIKTGDFILIGQTVLTEKKSQLLIRLDNGVLKLVPENSKVSFLDKEWLNLYIKSDSSIEKISATLGTKASEKKIWFDDQEANENQLQELLEKKQYLKIIVLYEKNPSNFVTSQSIQKAGISYFKLGLQEKSERCFQLLKNNYTRKEQESAYFALSLLAFRENNQEKAFSYLALLKKEFSESPFIKELNKIMALKENE